MFKKQFKTILVVSITFIFLGTLSVFAEWPVAPSGSSVGGWLGGVFNFEQSSSGNLVVNGDIESPGTICDSVGCIGAGGGGSVPAGTVSAFNLDSCPSGWDLADGTNGLPDLRGMFIRGLDDGTAGNDPDAPRSLGSVQNDEVKSHRHPTRMSNYGADYYPPGGGNDGNAFSGHLGRPAGGAESRPKNVALIYCVKDSSSTAEDDALFGGNASLAILNDSKDLQIDGETHLMERVGIGTTSPVQELDVNGKIKMRTQTSNSDSSDIVATKGYVDSKTNSGCFQAGNKCIIDGQQISAKGGGCTVYARRNGEKIQTRLLNPQSLEKDSGWTEQYSIKRIASGDPNICNLTLLWNGVMLSYLYTSGSWENAETIHVYAYW